MSSYDRDYDRRGGGGYDRGRSRSRSPRRDDYRRGGGGGGYRGGYDRPRRVSLLVRNLAFDTRSDEIKRLFDKYGEVKDVYMPINFYTKEPQGFAFVEFYDEKDAEYAKRKLDREFLNGREIAVIFAKQQRKRPDDMRQIEHRRKRSNSPRRGSRSRSRSRGGGGGRRRSRSLSPRRSVSPGGGAKRSPVPPVSSHDNEKHAAHRGNSASPPPLPLHRSFSKSPLRPRGR